MRIIIGVILARALRARDKDLSVSDSRAAAVFAGHGHAGEPGTKSLPGAIAHLQETYPDQLNQLRLARRVVLAASAGIILLVAVWRLLNG
ncbi:MAG: hypothetical protein AAF950_11555 [Pseudomonadota bacterium]